METEKRKHKRFSTSYQAELLIFKEEKIKSFVKIIDLSYSGAKIEATCELLKDEEVKLVLTLEENLIFNLSGKIVWIRKIPESGLTNYGIEFNEFGIFHKNSWERFINSKLQSDLSKQMEERRKYKRFKIDISIVNIKKSAISKKIKGYITDISMNGMNLFSVEDIPMQENVVVEFPYIEHIYFNVIGKIVWKNKLSDFFNYGIALDIDSDEQKLDLKNYVLLRIK